MVARWTVVPYGVPWYCKAVGIALVGIALWNRQRNRRIQRMMHQIKWLCDVPIEPHNFYAMIWTHATKNGIKNSLSSGKCCHSGRGLNNVWSLQIFAKTNINVEVFEVRPADEGGLWLASLKRLKKNTNNFQGSRSSRIRIKLKVIKKIDTGRDTGDRCCPEWKVETTASCPLPICTSTLSVIAATDARALGWLHRTFAPFYLVRSCSVHMSWTRQVSPSRWRRSCHHHSPDVWRNRLLPLCARTSHQRRDSWVSSKFLRNDFSGIPDRHASERAQFKN